MKKTIITLLALAGVAGAASITAVNGVYSFDEDDWAKNGQNFLLTFAEPVDLGANDWILSFTATVKPSVGTNQWGTAVLTSGDAAYPGGDHIGGFQFYIGVAGGGVIKGANITTTGNSGITIATLPKDTSAEYTFSISKVGTTTTYKIQDSQGSSLGSHTVSNYNWADKSLDKLSTSIGGVYGNTDNKQLTNGWSKPTGTFQIVPEPTTATLSLLALCGLAARRRRK